jgi:NAD(P)-dependent dehydrogenase (short-subunit alcohol dehydrogenase family)
MTWTSTPIASRSASRRDTEVSCGHIWRICARSASTLACEKDASSASASAGQDARRRARRRRDRGHLRRARADRYPGRAGDTPAALAGQPDELFAAVAARQALPHTLVPGDVAATVAFLASDAAAALTGQALCADGGLVLR